MRVFRKIHFRKEVLGGGILAMAVLAGVMFLSPVAERIFINLRRWAIGLLVCPDRLWRLWLVKRRRLLPETKDISVYLMKVNSKFRMIRITAAEAVCSLLQN